MIFNSIKKISQWLCCLAFGLFGATAQASANPDTTIRIGIPNRAPNGGIQGLVTTASDIDTRLNAVPGIPDNLVGDAIDAAYDSVEAYELEVEQEIADMLRDIPEIKSVSYARIDIFPFKAAFEQSSTDVRLELGDLSIQTKFKLDLGELSDEIDLSSLEVLCVPEFKVTFSVTDTELEYDFYSGTFEHLSSNVSLKVDDADCSSGVLSVAVIDDIALWLIDEILEPSDLVTAILQHAVDQKLNSITMMDFVGIQDLIEGLQQDVLTSGLPYSAQATQALSAADAIVSPNNFSGLNTRVDFVFDAGDSRLFELVASHIPQSDIGSVITSPSTVYVSVYPDSNDRSVQIFSRERSEYGGFSSWYYFGTLAPGSSSVSGYSTVCYVEEAGFMISSESNMFPGLYSRTGPSTTVPGSCGLVYNPWY